MSTAVRWISTEPWRLTAIHYRPQAAWLALRFE